MTRSHFTWDKCRKEHVKNKSKENRWSKKRGGGPKVGPEQGLPKYL